MELRKGSLVEHPDFPAAYGGNNGASNMRRELIGAALGLSATILLTSVVSAAQAPTTEDFVKTVAISDMFEVQSGQLASEKAQNGDVRSFGKQMVADHTKTTDQLKSLIHDKDIKVELPGKLDAEHQNNLDKLNNLSGGQFDKEFVRLQIDAHQKAIALFGGYAAAGENNDLKSWAKDTLPTLKEHLDHAQKLKTSVDQTAQTGGTVKSDELAAKSDETNDATARDEKSTVVKDDDKKPVHKSNINYITRQTPTDWTAEALIGRTVENHRATISATSIT
jgi:putative membrane protein